MTQLLRLRNAQGDELRLSDMGASWVGLDLMVLGKPRSVVLETALKHYPNAGYLGATIGRFANRIASARYDTASGCVQLHPNQGEHCLHGGPQGLSHRLWRIVDQGAQYARFECVSAHGDQGFIGNMIASARYELTDSGEVRIDYHATCDHDSICSLTNHAYFHLDGQGRDARAQTLQINSDHFIAVNAEGLPVSERTPVDGSGLDFRVPRRIDEHFLQGEQQRKVAGVDHSFWCQPTTVGALTKQATLSASDERLVLYMYSDAPVLHVYSGQYLHQTLDAQGRALDDFAGIALEAQVPPNAPNHPAWAHFCHISPSQPFRRQLRYCFERQV